MIDLEKIWKEQKKFQLNFYNPDSLKNGEQEILLKDQVLNVYRELGEILYELPTKSHRSNDAQRNDIENAREEAIDTFKFLLNVCMILGMTPKSFEKKFYEKSKVVKERYENEISKN